MLNDRWVHFIPSKTKVKLAILSCSLRLCSFATESVPVNEHKVSGTLSTYMKPNRM